MIELERWTATIEWEQEDRITEQERGTETIKQGG